MAQVYFIKLNNYVKIGLSTNVPYRFSQFQCASPYDLQIIRTIENCTREHEEWLHKQYAELYIKHEWFIFCESMLSIKVPSDFVRNTREQDRKESEIEFRNLLDKITNPILS